MLNLSMNEPGYLTIDQFNEYKLLVQQRDELKEESDQLVVHLMLGGLATAGLGQIHEIGYVVGGLGTLYLLYHDLKSKKKYKKAQEELSGLENKLLSQ